MIKTINIDGKEMTAIILGEEWTIDINDYRKAILSMFEMACLFNEFDQSIEQGQMWTILQFIQALGLPENKEKGGNDENP